MNTEQLIQSLSRDVRPVPRHAVAKRIGLGIAAGCVVAMLLVTVTLGVRPDLRVAMHGFSFWMKWTYTISLGLGAVYGISRLARPAPGSLGGLWLLAAPMLVLAGIGMGELDRDELRDLIPLDGVFEPVAANHEVYDRLFAEFPGLYKAQKGMFGRLNR